MPHPGPPPPPHRRRQPGPLRLRRLPTTSQAADHFAGCRPLRRLQTRRLLDFHRGLLLLRSLLTLGCMRLPITSDHFFCCSRAPAARGFCRGDAPARSGRLAPGGLPINRRAPGLARSGCSITFGQGLTAAAPGSAEATLTVSDIAAVRDELVGRGIDASAVWHGPPFPLEIRQPGPDPEHTSYGSFFSFNDPDDNTWLGPRGHDPAPRPSLIRHSHPRAKPWGRLRGRRALGGRRGGWCGRGRRWCGRGRRRR
jgi:hypothetical protein